MNDARNIARNDHVVSINNAMEIDRTQVNAESHRPGSTPHRRTAGVGGRLPVVQGRKEHPALRSSYRDKAGVLHSKIVPQLAPAAW